MYYIHYAVGTSLFNSKIFLSPRIEASCLMTSSQASQHNELSSRPLPTLGIFSGHSHTLYGLPCVTVSSQLCAFEVRLLCRVWWRLLPSADLPLSLFIHSQLMLFNVQKDTAQGRCCCEHVTQDWTLISASPELLPGSGSCLGSSSCWPPSPPWLLGRT